MFVSDLFEARPHRLGLMDKLAMFANDPEVYVTFTQILKVGINPISEWDDPVGIYAYPVQQIMQGKTAAQQGPNMGKLIPFAAERPFAYIVAATGNMLELQRYSEADLDRDLEIIKNKFRADLGDIDDELISGWLHIWRAHAGLAFWRVSQRLANHAERNTPSRSARMIWHKMIRACGYDGVVDRGEGIIHPGEPAQAVILHTGALRVLEAVPNNLKI